MNNKKLLIIISGIIILIALVVVVIIFLRPNEDNDSIKDSLEDFGTAKSVVLIQDETNLNFDITIEKGEYQEGDAIYIFYRNQYVLTSKYRITQQDVETLKNENIKVYISCLCNFAALYEYYFISEQDVSDFEQLIKNKQQYNIWLNEELLMPPVILKAILTSSLSDNLIEEDEYENNDEVISAILMQSQLYKPNTKVIIVDEDNNELISKTLDTENLSILEKDNLQFNIEVNEIVNTIQNEKGIHNFSIKIIQGEEEIYQYELTVNVL